MTVHRGYITITTRPFGRIVYIPRNVLVKLLKWLIPLVREMDTNVDPVLNMRAQEAVDDAIRAQRKELRRAPGRPRRRPRNER